LPFLVLGTEAGDVFSRSTNLLLSTVPYDFFGASMWANRSPGFAYIRFAVAPIRPLYLLSAIEASRPQVQVNRIKWKHD